MASTDLAQDVAELRQMVLQLSRMVEISVTLNSTLDIDKLLQFIIDSAADLVNSQAASILLVDDKTQDLYVAASTGSDPAELAQIPVPMQGSIAGTILQEDRPMIINNVAQEPRHFSKVGDKLKFEVRSLVGVPMRIRDRNIGVLEAVNKREGGFTEADVRTLSIIASQAAVAINNARLLKALQRAYDELGKLEKLKSDFIAIASHELRTPLGIILGYAAILQDEATDEASSEYSTVVLNSALRMRALIEDMTNMNMLRVGAAEMDFEVRPLAPLVRAAYDELNDLIQAKGQEFRLEIGDEDLRARVDAERLTMALTNLLNNSMRFTPDDGHIRLSLERRGREAWLCVFDDGAGIPEGQLEAVFDEFYQVEDHMTRTHEGMGLGLAIVKAVVETHEGRVWAESGGGGVGTTFTIALPLVG